MTTGLAIDISNYTTPFTAAGAEALYAAGVRRAIVQAVNPQVLTHRGQIPALLAAGIEVEGYVYVWFSAGAEWAADRVRWACDEFSRYPAMRHVVWLDCEQSDHDTPPFDYVHAPTSPTIRACIDAAREKGFKPGIYTAAWWWIPGVSNSREFADAGIPLWNANYDLDPDLDEVDFGGWRVPRMEQYQGWGEIASVGGVDLNTYLLDEVPIDPVLAHLEAAKREIDAAIAARKGG